MTTNQNQKKKKKKKVIITSTENSSLTTESQSGENSSKSPCSSSTNDSNTMMIQNNATTTTPTAKNICSGIRNSTDGGVKEVIHSFLGDDEVEEEEEESSDLSSDVISRKRRPPGEVKAVSGGGIQAIPVRDRIFYGVVVLGALVAALVLGLILGFRIRDNIYQEEEGDSSEKVDTTRPSSSLIPTVAPIATTPTATPAQGVGAQPTTPPKPTLWVPIPTPAPTPPPPTTTATTGNSTENQQPSLGSATMLDTQPPLETLLIPTTPTTTNFTAPNASITPAPTFSTIVLDMDLPGYSMDALNDPNSPQSKAMEWLVNSTTHPRTKQLFSLATFHFAMDGPKWPSNVHWLNEDENDDECLWTYSTSGTGNINEPCNQQGQYHGLLLNNLNLSPHQPHLPKEVALLTQLETIQLAANDIYASLDNMLQLRLYRLRALKEINLSNNMLFGSIPATTTGWFTRLTNLQLHENRLIGKIPTSLSKLTNLVSLNLSHNSLTGVIPTQLGLLTILTYLDLSYNFLSKTTSGGTPNIPTELLANTDLTLIV